MTYIYEEDIALESLAEVEPELVETLQKKIAGRYNVYPPNNKPEPFVIQRHEIGDSNHFDFRFKVNGYLIGWSVVGFSKDNPATIETLLANIGKGFRAETKASQPCIAPDTLVFTRDGLKEAGRITMNDLLLGKDGVFHRVVQIDRGIKDKGYIIKTSYGVEQKVTQHHPYLVVIKAFCPYHGYFDVKRTLESTSHCEYCRLDKVLYPIIEWKEAKDLEVRDIVLFPKEIREYWKRPIRQVSPQYGRLLGFFIGDGTRWNKNGVRLLFNALKEESKAEYYNAIVRELSGNTGSIRREKNVLILSFTNETSRCLLKDGYENETKSIKLEFLGYPKGFRKELLFGLIDSDGYWISQDCFYFATSNPRVAEGFWLLCSSLGIPCSMRYRENTSKLVSRTKKKFEFMGYLNKEHNEILDLGYYWGFRVIDKKDLDCPEYINIVTNDHTILVPFAITHNTIWLNVEGQVKPGEVGAGVEKPGKFTILTGTKKYKDARVIFGCQKPYFHEYFLKDGVYFKDWTRIVFRQIKQEKLEPETKRPTGKTELFWRFMIPKDQKPYALARGMKEGWYPPEGIIPFPYDWAKKNYPEDVAKWEEYIKQATKETKLSKAKFCIVEFRYKGPKHIRDVWRREWHLLIDDGKEKVMDFVTTEHPIYIMPLAYVYNGRIDKKWFGYEGNLKPLELWNPNKELNGIVEVLIEGDMDIDSKIVNDKEVYIIDIDRGVMKGKYAMAQEEEDSPFYIFDELTKLALAADAVWVYDKHTIEGVPHWDLRFRLNIEGEWESVLHEFSGMDKPLHEAGIEEPVEVIAKICKDLSWIDPNFKEGRRKVGGIWTEVERIDQGKAIIYNATDDFWSFNLDGEILSGYIIAKRTDGGWVIMKSRLPSPKLSKEGTGNPVTGDYYKEFKIEQKKGWDYFIVHIYDSRAFTRAEPAEMVKEYLPDLKLPEGVDVRIGLYPVVGALHHVRVMNVKFPSTWTVAEAVAWIKKNNLHKWGRERIVKKQQ